MKGGDSTPGPAGLFAGSRETTRGRAGGSAPSRLPGSPLACGRRRRAARSGTRARRARRRNRAAAPRARGSSATLRPPSPVTPGERCRSVDTGASPSPDGWISTRNVRPWKADASFSGSSLRKSVSPGRGRAEEKLFHETGAAVHRAAAPAPDAARARPVRFAGEAVHRRPERAAGRHDFGTVHGVDGLEELGRHRAPGRAVRGGDVPAEQRVEDGIVRRGVIVAEPPEPVGRFGGEERGLGRRRRRVAVQDLGGGNHGRGRDLSPESLARGMEEAPRLVLRRCSDPRGEVPVDP